MKPTSSYAMHHKLCAYLYFVLLSTVMSPSLHADDAVGSIAGELSVTQGQLSWSADITAPSGVNNHTPKLAIQYAHRGDGLLGYGFRLTGLAKITVCQASRYLDGEDRSLEFNDNAKYCYNGKRLVDWSSSQFPASVNTYKLAEDNGLIVVQEGGNHPGSSSWRVLKPTGETLYLGTTQDSQKIVKGENGQSVVSAWYLNTAVDAFDNEINYTYAQLDGTLVLSQVDYDNKRVEMNYERRQSTTSSVEYERGRAQQLNHILESIKVYGDVNKPYMHAYQLTYDTVGVNQRHRLSSITQCSVENRCFPPTQFEWGDQTGESANAQIQTSLEVPMHGLASNLKSLDTEKNPQFADLNADGLNDICVSDMVYNDSRDTSVHLYCATNLGNGEFSKFERWFSRKAPRDNYRDLRLIDVDNDRKADLCYKYLWFGMQDNDKFRERVDYVCYKNAPDKKYNFSQRLLSLPLKSGDITSIADDVRLSDLNNDRVLDACANTGIGKNRKVMCALGSIKNVGLEKHNPIIVGGLNSNAFPTFQDIIQGELLQWDAAKDDMKSPGNNSFAVIDINADGVIDYCAADDNGFSCHLRTGDKTNVQPTHRSVYSNTDIKLSSTTHASFRYVHLNNDHLVDVCFIDDDAYKCAINTGVGFDAPTVWTSDIDAKHVKRQDISMLDVNNDGAADLCRLDRNNQFICAINRGDHFEGYVNYFSHDISVHKDTHASNIFAGDVSGDSKTDVCYVEGNLLKCDISNHDNQSRLSSITSGLGNTATITYGRLDNPQIYSGANDASNHMEDVHGKGVVVSSISKSDGVDGVLTQHYRYSDLRYDWYKKKLSFAQIDVINSTHKTLDRHQFYQSENGDNNSASVAMGLLKSTHTYLLPMADAVSADAIPHDMLSSFPSASLLSEEQLTYTISKPFSSSVTTQILDDTKINIVYADDGRIESRKIFTATDHDKYGKPQKTSTSIDRGSGTSVAKSFKDVLTYKNRVITSGTHWRYYAGLVKSHYKYYNVGGTNNSSHHRRVAAAVNQYGTRGELRFTTEKFSAKSEGLHIEYKYDANGRIEEIIKGDAADLASFIHSEQSRSSTTVYDAFGRVDYTLNALNEKTQYHYDLGRPQCSHAPDEIVDANHHVTKIVYDDFCIKTKETRAGEPSPLSTTWHTTWLNDYPLGHYNPHTAVYKTVEQSDGGNTVTRYYDSYQREIRVETIGFEGKKVYSDKVYDSRGRLAKYTKPYFEGEFAGDNRYWVEHSYDEHNRKIKITDNTQNGQRITKHEYGLGYTKTTDPENKVKETWHHADGTIAKVEEANGESTILHQYNAFGQVVLTNTNGKIVSIEYDAAGRKKKLTDASIGHETYQYNVFGELRKSTDANGVIVRYAYDPLGRMRKQWSEGHDKNINNSWQYGNSQVDHNVGLLVSESSNSSDKTYRYDHLSRLEQVTTSIDGKLFTQTYTYDAFNRANSETMPDGMVVEREYSDIGQLSAVKIQKINSGIMTMNQ